MTLGRRTYERRWPIYERFFNWMLRGNPEIIMNWLNTHNDEERKAIIASFGGKEDDWKR